MTQDMTGAAHLRTAVITTVNGRHEHLRQQERMLAAVPEGPDLRIVVSMADPAVADLVGPGTVVVPQPAGRTGLPLAAARNLGAETAIATGAALLIFLDVDCLPGPGTVTGYRRAATGPAADDLLGGVVAYLPPPPPGGYDPRRLAEHPGHPARPVPPAGVEQPGADHRLFWSLSFAVRATTWRRIGGFDEQYEGYGGEDTDFALRARHRGVGFTWVGGAEAYHQWHPSGSPPVRHLDDILRNGARFARRWGFWPMQGWLDQFAELGLVTRTGSGWVRA